MQSRRVFTPLLRPFLADVLICLRFYSRLPIPLFTVETRPWDSGTLGRALRAAPIAGLGLGALGALVLAAGTEGLGLPSSVASTLALGALILLSGGLHEDGLADVADGFGGGSDTRRKLDIMRDSRIGAYGALALTLSVALRIGTLAALLDRYGLGVAAMALAAAEALSRGFGLFPLALLPPARTDGAAHAAGPLPLSSVGCATGLAMFLGMILPVMEGLSEGRAFAACAAAGLASLAVTRLARRQIGGHTGDVAGAAQQGAEMAYLLALLVFRF